ncbi:MAG: hypothetical protein PWP31_1094 [Clostridia bacterium]|nr:hypothetical protein [Clostridia bacterium]
MEIYPARWSNRRKAKGDLSVTSNGIRVRSTALEYLSGANHVLIGVDQQKLVLKRSEDPSNLKLRIVQKGKVGEIGGKNLTNWLLERGFNKGQYKVTMGEDKIIVTQQLA